MTESELRHIIREELEQIDESRYRSSEFKKMVSAIDKLKKNIKAFPQKYRNKVSENIAQIEFYIDEFGIVRQER